MPSISHSLETVSGPAIELPHRRHSFADYKGSLNSLLSDEHWLTHFSCLGLSALSACLYNPAQPSTIYFSIGEFCIGSCVNAGYSAVLFTDIPVQASRLWAPVYISYHPRVLGIVCAVAAALLPNLPLAHQSFLEYPIVWEITGGLLTAISYATMTALMLRPARVYSVNLRAFVGAAATFLTEADDSDRARFAEDLLLPGNLGRLVQIASAWTGAQQHGAMIEFERLQEIGAPLTIRGRPPISAFYIFAHREELRAASDAATLLRILSDPQFCSVLVRRCPWLTASLLQYISRARLHPEQLRPFIRQLATEAIRNEESFIAKEIGYEGFGRTPYLSESLFGDWFMLSQYDPLHNMHLGSGGQITEGYVDRLNSVAKLILQTALKNQDLYPQSYLLSVHATYENLYSTLSFGLYNDVSGGFLAALHIGVSQLYRELQSAMMKIPMERLVDLYAEKEESAPWDNIVAAVTEIIYDSLEFVANQFEGFNDRNWSYVISIFQHIFPPYGNQDQGLDPLQQRLAIKLIDKLRDNMKGYYPSISRVLLAAIGPYGRRDHATKGTPAGIIRDAVYKEFLKLKDLYAAQPDKFSNYFPPQVKYDIDADLLTFSYRSGEPVATTLGDLEIDNIRLTDRRYWRWVPMGDGMGWTL